MSVESRYTMLEKKIELILEFAKGHPEFTIDFVDSLHTQLEERGTLSPRQEEALDSIIDKWGMDE